MGGDASLMKPQAVAARNKWKLKKKYDSSSSLNVTDNRFIQSAFKLLLTRLLFTRFMWAQWERSGHADLI